MPVKFFTKRPPRVCALQFIDTNLAEVAEFLSGTFGYECHVIETSCGDRTLVIKRYGGDAQIEQYAQSGHWIVADADGMRILTTRSLEQQYAGYDEADE